MTIVEPLKADAQRNLLQDRQTYVARGVSNAHPVVTARAENARLWDTQGREYIDFVGGIGVLNVGHNHPRVVAAVREQAELFLHTCFQVAMYPGYVDLCRRLRERSRGRCLRQAWRPPRTPSRWPAATRAAAP